MIEIFRNFMKRKKYFAGISFTKLEAKNLKVLEQEICKAV